MSLKNIKIGGVYTCIKNSQSVEVIEFKTIILEDDSYQNKLEVIIYVDENSTLQSMQIDTFSNSFC